jgi:hypothetical protein
MPWNGRAEAPADMVFRLGKVPAHLEAADHIAPIFETQGHDHYVLRLPGTGRMLVRHGCEVTVEPEPDADLTAICAIFTGPIQSVLWHQRGLLPLHATAVVVDGRAIALGGPSGSGKSTLAARLSAKGYMPMADGVCAIDMADGKPISVLPGIPHLQLWRDALDRLGIAVDGLTRILSTKEKFLLERRGGLVDVPQPLAAVVVILRRISGEIAIERLRGAAAVTALRDNVHLQRPARALGRDPAIFAALTRMVSAGVTVWRLTVPDDPACLDAAAAQVLTVLEA